MRDHSRAHTLRNAVKAAVWPYLQHASHRDEAEPGAQPRLGAHHVNAALEAVHQEFHVRFDASLFHGLVDHATDLIEVLVEHLQLVRQHHDQAMDAFFRTGWRSRAHLYPHSGVGLVDAVNALHPRAVLDVGCGNNDFRGVIPNLTGVDLVNPRADVICDFLEYTSAHPFDVILALGSINFGGRAQVTAMLARVKDLLAPGGTVFMRVNPGMPWPDHPGLRIYPWSEALIHAHGSGVGLQVCGSIIQEEGPDGLRLYFTYRHADESGDGDRSHGPVSGADAHIS